MNEDFRNILEDLRIPGIAHPDEQKKAEWELVLIAMGIDHAWGEDGELLVPKSQAVKAIDEIRLYEEEEKQFPKTKALPVLQQQNVYANLFVLSLLLLFFTIVYEGLGGPEWSTLPWLEQGRVDAARIMDGEIWRTVTALTLHSDPAHVLGNVIIGAPFILTVCTNLGMGLGWLAIILAGALGNYVNAWVMAPTHLSIGFSTSVFAAVGIMAITAIKHSRLSVTNAFVLGLALLALLGVGGENTDLGAHLFGLLAGFLIGWLAMVMRDTVENVSKVDFLFGMTAILLVVESWLIALFGEGLLDVFLVSF
ncbi:rhomboid family intramembrane serine protease [Desulfonatronovibrio magnus]|uniref:rhomboid family intramembrane serine protease n=1 Tax=Desulfonatronovibrio magnus TaxID=698827 RepID=UPI000698DDEA|nr:rhomboid family intramembrane serine protease [Desulfonatronovibrio magnus]